jgi:hypothetical protein
MQPVSKQRIGKQTSTTMGLLLEMVFSIRFVQSGYKGEDMALQFRKYTCKRLKLGGGQAYDRSSE